jgi:FtsZ-binding cell division protein ZapB
MSESEAETDTDFSESESDMSVWSSPPRPILSLSLAGWLSMPALGRSANAQHALTFVRGIVQESESDAGSDAESDSDNSSSKSRKSKKGDKSKQTKKLEARCKQLETILLETKRELAEKKVDILQLQRQLKEKESMLLISSPSASSGSIRSSSGSSSSGSGGDLKKAIEERDLKIERLEASLKGKDDEIKAVKSLFQTEIEELRRKNKTTTSSRKAVAEDTDDDGDEEDDDREEEWQMRVDRAAALYDFKARNDQEISLTYVYCFWPRTRT